MPITIPKTRKALMHLGEVVQCVVCLNLATKPYSFSECVDVVCYGCVPKVVELTCPKCHIQSLSPLDEVQDPKLLGVLQIFQNFVTKHRPLVAQQRATEALDSVDSDNADDEIKSEIVTPIVTSKKQSKIVMEPSDEIDPSKGAESNSTKRRGKATTLPINKRNKKGETSLHISCILGDLDKVKKFLAEGADANTQDNARWTPLHEAASRGFTEIATSLLESGALASVPAGETNITPLHDAVQRRFIDVAKVLLKFGANVAARDTHGKTPKDYAESKVMKDLLNQTKGTKLPPPKKTAQTPKAVRMVVFGADLSQDHKQQLKKLCAELKIKTASYYATEVTHLLMETNGVICKPTTDMLKGMLEGKFIISANWIAKCLTEKSILDPLMFEVAGTDRFPNSNAPRRARENKQNHLPSLFNGCSIFLRQIGLRTEYTYDGIELSKTEVTALIKTGGGTVLTREPNPESLFNRDKMIVPYHVAPKGPLAKCSQYIVYQDGDRGIKYNMETVKALPAPWLFGCMESFRIMDPES